MNEHKYLVHAVTQCLELLDSPSRLLIWVVSSANCPHARRLVAGVALGTVVEIRVWAARTVSENRTSQGISETCNHNIFHLHANVACHSYVRAAVRLTHNCDHGDLWIRSAR